MSGWCRNKCWCPPQIMLFQIQRSLSINGSGQNLESRLSKYKIFSYNRLTLVNGNFHRSSSRMVKYKIFSYNQFTLVHGNFHRSSIDMARFKMFSYDQFTQCAWKFPWIFQQHGSNERIFQSWSIQTMCMEISIDLLYDKMTYLRYSVAIDSHTCMKIFIDLLLTW